MQEIAMALHEEFGHRYNIKTGEIKYCFMYIGSFFDKGAAEAIASWNVDYELINTRSREILGINYRPMKETLVDMGHSMI